MSGGKLGGGATFDGQDDNLKVNMNVSTNGTISIWLKANLDPNEMIAIWNGKATENGYGTGNEIHIGSSSPVDGRFLLYITGNDGSTCNAFSTTNYSEDLSKWYHVVGTYDSDSCEIYVDGDLEGTDNSFNGINLTGYDSLRIGSEIQNSREWNGTIDETAIYNKSLNASKIEDLYQLNGGVTKYYWKVNATDTSGNSNESDVWEFTTTSLTITANFTSSIGIIDDNFYGANVDSSPWKKENIGIYDNETRDANWNTTSHEIAWLNSNMNLMASVGSPDGKFFSPRSDAEQWGINTSYINQDITSSSCNIPYGFACNFFNSGGRQVTGWNRSTDAHGGLYSADIMNNDMTADIYSSYSITLPVNRNYNLSVWIKSDDIISMIALRKDNGELNCSESTTGSGNWEQLNCTIYANDTQTSWSILPAHVNAGESALWDDFTFIADDGKVYVNAFNYTQLQSGVKFMNDNGGKYIYRTDKVPAWLGNLSDGCLSDAKECEPYDYDIWGNITNDNIYYYSSNGLYNSTMMVEVGNEPYLSEWYGDLSTDNITKATHYVNYFNNTRNSIKSVYPNMQVGGPSGHDMDSSPNIFNTFLSNFTNNEFDYLSIHPYSNKYEKGEMEDSLNGIISSCLSHGANCSNIILTEWQVVNILIKNTTSNANRYSMNIGVAYSEILNLLNLASFKSLIYQWTMFYNYNNTANFPQYPQYWNMYVDNQLLAPGESQYKSPYNITKSFSTSHPPGSTVYTSTSDNNNVKVVSSKNGNDFFITLINTDTESVNATVDTQGLLTKLSNQETGEEFSSATGVFELGVLDGFEILYMGYDSSSVGGLVARLKLNENTGTTAFDISGNVNDGTISGAIYNNDGIQITLVENTDYSFVKPILTLLISEDIYNFLITSYASSGSRNDLRSIQGNYSKGLINTSVQFPAIGTIIGIAILLIILIALLIFVIVKMMGVSTGSNVVGTPGSNNFKGQSRGFS